MQKTKGFTLIELLVVIAIIGILSGLIIVSMSGAQNAAKDARVKAAMDQFRSTSEIYKLNNAGYGATAIEANTGACSGVSGSLIATGSDGLALCSDIQSQGTGSLYIHSSTTAYCIQKTLPGGQIWCLDSTGAVGCVTGTSGCVSSYAGCATAADMTCL